MKKQDTAQAVSTQKQATSPQNVTKTHFATDKPPKGKFFFWLRIFIYLATSSFLLSFGTYSLISPNGFTIGGVSGIAILVSVATNGKIPQSLVLFVINLPLVTLAFFFIKKKFALLSAANILLQTLWLIILENAFPNFRISFSENGEKIFAALAGGICIGASLALAFKIGGSTGGADILAVMIQRKFTAASISWMLFMINCVVIGASVFVFRGETWALTMLPVMMAIFEAYIESKTNESITSGFHSAIEFRIITHHPTQMAQALMQELSRGVTSLPATGMYTGENYSMLLCVVHRRQVATLKRIMKQIDPDSFAVMGNVSQVLGKGFTIPEL